MYFIVSELLLRVPFNRKQFLPVFTLWWDSSHRFLASLFILLFSSRLLFCVMLSTVISHSEHFYFHLKRQLIKPSHCRNHSHSVSLFITLKGKSTISVGNSKVTTHSRSSGKAERRSFFGENNYHANEYQLACVASDNKQI